MRYALACSMVSAMIGTMPGSTLIAAEPSRSGSEVETKIAGRFEVAGGDEDDFRPARGEVPPTIGDAGSEPSGISG